jgi:hypothetical protein
LYAAYSLCLIGSLKVLLRESLRLLKIMGVKQTIKPRRNARTDRGPPERRISATMFKRFGGEKE